jgi:hypothetical protein
MEPPSPGCVDGVCAHKEHAIRDVGAPCTTGAECKTGECLTFAGSKLWPGGYCTISDCHIKDIACPAGSSCRDPGDGRGYCMKECDPAMRLQCRSEEGYGCCTGPGPSGKLGWCSSLQSPLCTSR